jgi:hypothetical protein
MAPRLNPEQLADGLSVTATNVDLSETLQGWCSPLDLSQVVPTAATHLFHYAETYWFSWDTPTQAIEAPLLNDPFKTVIITDGDFPKVTRLDIATGGSVFPNIAYRLGLPEPGVVTHTVDNNELYSGPSSGDSDYDGTDLDDFTTSYKITFIDIWGRESVASFASENATIREYEGQMVLKVTLTFPAVPTGYPLLGDGSQFRIYRLNNSSTGQGIYQFLADVDSAESTYVDRLTSADLQEGLFADDWLPPPDDNLTNFPNGPLQHICVLSEAFLGGHNDKMVCFSEPRVTHAWPSEYYMVFAEKIICTVNYGADMVVLTNDHPYIVSGVSPASISRVRLASPAPAINSEAVVEVAGAVFYAGKRGLYVIDGNQVILASETFYDAKQWRALQPTTMRFLRHQDNLVIKLFDGRILMFDPTNPTGGFTSVELDTKALHNDPQSESLVYSDSSGNLFEFDGGSENMAVTFESKHYRFHDPKSMYVGRVRANSYPVDVEFVTERRNGNQYSTVRTVTDDTFFYLETKSEAVEFFMRVAGDVDIRSIGWASSIQELNADV